MLPMKSEAEKIPVTLIGGFLGAGKTTLIKHILTERHDKKIAVIENEFGAETIDDKLGIAERLETTEDLITLGNGCVCCTVRADLEDAFLKLANSGIAFDAVVVELSGIADPAPVAFTLTSTSAGEHFKIDSIVCVADAKHVIQHLTVSFHDKDDVNEAIQQVAYADRILLNKVDTVTANQLAIVTENLRSINSFARIVECTHSRVAMDDIIGVASFTMNQASMLKEELAIVERVEEERKVKEGEMAPCCKNKTCKKSKACPKKEEVSVSMDVEDDANINMSGRRKKRKVLDVHRKDGRTHKFGGVTSTAVKLDTDLHISRLSNFLDTFLAKHGADLYRTKGIVSFAGSEHKWILQGVHEDLRLFESQEVWKPGEQRVSTVVFIGRKLDATTCRSSLEACCMRPGEEMKESL